MTDKREDGGPAFPTEPRGPVYGDKYDGMTLRDWFAGQALAGIIAHPNLEGWEPAITAKWAYEIADAMLEARK